MSDDHTPETLLFSAAVRTVRAYAELIAWNPADVCAVILENLPMTPAAPAPAPARYPRTDLRSYVVAHIAAPHGPMTGDEVGAAHAAADAWLDMTSCTPDDGLYPTMIEVAYGTEGARCITLIDDSCGSRVVKILADESSFDGDAYMEWSADTDHYRCSGSRTVLLSVIG